MDLAYPALRRLVASVRAGVLVVSYNDESWVSLEDLVATCSARGHVAVLALESARFVGARIGMYTPSGEKVGRVSRLRNVEHLLVAGPGDAVGEMTAAPLPSPPAGAVLAALKL